ncbi:30S ribosomal protein S6 [Candidatus Kaiserbacteria bacterium]|nr:30S ribosomal protein S6 [Candidatus Kaiserbacteria bacterium]
MAKDIVAEIDAKDTPETSELRIYEVGYHIIPTVKEEELDGVVGKIRALIEKAGGSFIAEGAPVQMKLSYPMSIRENERHSEYDHSYFGWLKFEAPVEAALVLEKTLQADMQILRSIVFRTVREETRARLKLGTLREVRRTDTIKAPVRRVEEVSAPVSEVDLDKALEELTTE